MVANYRFKLKDRCLMRSNWYTTKNNNEINHTSFYLVSPLWGDSFDFSSSWIFANEKRSNKFWNCFVQQKFTHMHPSCTGSKNNYLWKSFHITSYCFSLIHTYQKKFIGSNGYCTCFYDKNSEFRDFKKWVHSWLLKKSSEFRDFPKQSIRQVK